MRKSIITEILSSFQESMTIKVFPAKSFVFADFALLEMLYLHFVFFGRCAYSYYICFYMRKKTVLDKKHLNRLKL